MKYFERLRILVVVLLGMSALGLLTWGIGKVYLELVGHSGGAGLQAQTSNQKIDGFQNNVLILPKASFWTCQIGVYKNEENAQACLKQLKQLNYPVGVISSNPWIVGIGLGHTASDLSGLKQLLAEKGIHVLVKQVELPERTFRVAGNGSRLTAELLLNVNTLLQQGLSPQILNQEKQIWDDLAGDRSPSELEQLHQLYNVLREKNSIEEQRLWGLAIFFEAVRIINVLSGK
jgi:hypothetical protein